MEMLGISNRYVMMQLTIECNKHCRSKSKKEISQSGAPQFDIPESVLEHLLENGFKVIDISKLLGVSVRTIYRRMVKYDLSRHSFSLLTDDNLDVHVERIINEFPLCGENMIMQILRQTGIDVQRYRLRDSMHIIDPVGISERKRSRLHSRVYEVMGPNHLWHIDTNHKLVRWRFVIIGGIDGFSRMVTFLSCADNNRASTVLKSFKSGVETFHAGETRDWQYDYWTQYT